MPEPSPATAEADSEKDEARCRPWNPSLVAKAQEPVDQDADPPSELVTPLMSRAAIGEWPGRQALARRKAGVGVLGRQAGHGHGPLSQLAAAVDRDIGAGDRGLAPADEDPQAEVA
jgi:hypothetical protein